MTIEMVDRTGELDSVAAIDEAINAVHGSLVKGFGNIPAELAVNLGLISRALKLYLAIAKHESKKMAKSDSSAEAGR